jgi:general stress protein 26
MATDSNLQFIREKIYQVRSAIMYSMSDEVIKFPNSIATAVRVDDEGQLWFLCKKPVQFVSECEQNFPARLKFYRKGISFFLEVSGKATIVNNNSSLNFLEKKCAGKTCSYQNDNDQY